MSVKLLVCLDRSAYKNRRHSYRWHSFAGKCQYDIIGVDHFVGLGNFWRCGICYQDSYHRKYINIYKATSNRRRYQNLGLYGFAEHPKEVKDHPKWINISQLYARQTAVGFCRCPSTAEEVCRVLALEEPISPRES